MAELFLEFARQAQKIIRHHEAGYVFNAGEEEVLSKFEDSVADSIIVGKMILVRMEEHYGRATHEIMDRQSQRMKARGYCSQGKEKSSVLAHRRFEY